MRGWVQHGWNWSCASHFRVAFRRSCADRGRRFAGWAYSVCDKHQWRYSFSYCVAVLSVRSGPGIVFEGSHVTLYAKAGGVVALYANIAKGVIF